MNMEKKENSQGRDLKLYETFTEEREVNFSTGENCYLSRLEGGLILLDESVKGAEQGIVGAPGKKIFTFKAIFPGAAAYQLVHTRASDSHILYEQVLPVQVEDNDSDLLAGGWTDQHDLSPEEMLVFREATKDYYGVDYTPLSVAIQIVKGTNYCYVCSTKSVTNPPQLSNALVYVYRPLPAMGSRAMITKIVPFLKD